MSKNEHGYCPHCGADWDGEPVPKEYGSGVFGRHICIEDPMVYDGVIAAKCPDCNKLSGYGAGNLKMSDTDQRTVFEVWNEKCVWVEEEG